MLRFRLTFPFPPLFEDLLAEYQCSPAQLHCNVVCYIMAFTEHCKAVGVKPRYELLRALVTLGKGGGAHFTFCPHQGTRKLFSLPTNNAGWNKKVISFNRKAYPVPGWNTSLARDNSRPSLTPEIQEDINSLMGVPFDLSKFGKHTSGYEWPQRVFSYLAPKVEKELETEPSIADERTLYEWHLSRVSRGIGLEGEKLATLEELERKYGRAGPTPTLSQK
jgi:hypothetical protein